MRPVVVAVDVAADHLAGLLEGLELFAPRAAELELGEPGLDFYCTRACEEGTISDRVAAAMAELGWTGQGHGSKAIYALEPTGEQTVWVNGDWMNVDEARRDHPELFTGNGADDPESD